MVLFHVTYTALPGKAETFLQAVREAGLLETIRKEDGCLGYDTTCPGSSPTRFCWWSAGGTARPKRPIWRPPHGSLGELKGRYIGETRVWSCTAEE